MSIQSTALVTDLAVPGVAGESLLAVRGLTVEFETRGGALRAVNDVSFSLGRGKILAIIGRTASMSEPDLG
jgi:ABC-type microcin C transport system duplicated ATPase subunit YejF